MADAAEDSRARGAAGYQMKEPRQKRKLEPFLPIIHEILKQDQQGPEEAAAHGPADLRSAAGRARLRRRPDDRQGRGAGLEAAAGRGVCAAGAPAGRSPGRFRRSAGQASWRAGQGGVVRDDPALLGRDLLPGVSQGVHRDVPGGPQAGVRVLRRRAAADQLRQQQDRGGQDHGRPRPGSDPRVPAAGEPLTCSSITSAWCGGPTRRAMSRTCWAMPGATSWCRCPRPTAWKRSTPSWRSGAGRT